MQRVALRSRVARFSAPPRVNLVPRQKALPRYVHVERLAAPLDGAFRIDPYIDYGRRLTPEGGILFTYKDIDESLGHILLRIALWSFPTGFEAWFLANHSPVSSFALNALCLFVMALINWFIVNTPVEIYRTIEIRPDCMILDGKDLFWRLYMETGWPAFMPAANGTMRLSGIYGTRQLDYLTIRRFDDADRTPEVLAVHLNEAIKVLWEQPQ